MEEEISSKKLLGIAGTAWLFDEMDVGILSFIREDCFKRIIRRTKSK